MMQTEMHSAVNHKPISTNEFVNEVSSWNEATAVLMYQISNCCHFPKTAKPLLFIQISFAECKGTIVI